MKCDKLTKCYLATALHFKNGKKRPKTEGLFPVYGGNGILGYTNDFNSEDCVVIGRVGAYCGSVYREKHKCWISDNAICGLSYNGSSIDFLYYLLKSLHLNNRHIGTSQPLLTQEILNKIEVSLPSIEIQRRIADILGTIDDKIELNNKINDNLEQQAQSLFKSWFVDFEPFDGEMPTKWCKSTLDNIAIVASGKRPHIKQVIKTDDVCIPLVGAADVMGYTNEALYNDKILVTGRVGTHGVIQRFNSPCWASDNTLVLKSNSYEYVYQVLKKIDYQNMNRGSTQPLITQSDLKNVEIVLPTEEFLCTYEQIAGALMKHVDENVVENDKLAELRDTLLPKLMSGELDISKIDI